MTEVKGPLLVVALDGSEPARAAFGWALRRVARTGGRVRAVRARDVRGGAAHTGAP
jgi:nucleotide-binding universal stress UspA family protein